MIDEKAQIHASAEIADGVTIGPWTLIGPNVRIGKGTRIGAHVVVKENTTIGENNDIHSFASIGDDPQCLSFKGQTTQLVIGDNNLVREFCTLNRGTEEGGGVTQIGNHNYFMAYTHVAHDCRVGNHTVFSNNASIAGHVEVGDHVIFGAFTGVHQRCRIGAYSFLGRACKVVGDVLPFLLIEGNPGVPRGLNLVGLQRNGFSEETIRRVKEAYRILYRRGLKLEEAMVLLREHAAEVAEVRDMLTAIEQSHRGIARPDGVHITEDF